MPKLLYDSVKLYNVILAEDEPDGDDVNKNINAFPQQTIKPTIHQTCFTNETSNQ